MQGLSGQYSAGSSEGIFFRLVPKRNPMMELLEERLVSASDSIFEGLCVVLYTFGFMVLPASQSVVAHCSK